MHRIAGRRRVGAAVAVVVAATLGIMPAAAVARATEVGSLRIHDAEQDDPIQSLRRRIESGEVTLRHDSAHGFLPALLDALDVPVSSQTLVFSRTSLQTDYIGPWSPRAVYFSDDVYVAWVQESSRIEIAAIDPDDGIVFYTLSDTDPAQPVVKPESRTCLMCHEVRTPDGAQPQLLVLSVLADRLGYPMGSVHAGSTTDRTPYDRRWGGWYVTGTHGEMPHSGNVHAESLSHEVTSGDAYAASFDFGAGANVTDLGHLFHTDAYLTPHSDIVALLVLTHQAYVHNLIGLVRSETSAAIERDARRSARDATVAGEGDYLPSTLARVDGAVDRLFRAMLFMDEAPLTDSMAGTSTFTADFAAVGPASRAGHTLREFDLETRLFRYRLSFLIHSDAFRGLPELARTRFAERLVDVLGGSTPSDLSSDERTTILEILRETEPGLLELARVP